MIKTISNIEFSTSEIKGIRYVSGNEEFVIGHYPHQSIFPGVLSLKLIISLLQDYCARMKINGTIKSIPKVQYLGIIEPGDELLIHIKKNDETDYTINFTGEILSDISKKVKANIIINKDYGE